MDAQELRNLQEAYMEVVENQQQLDEAKVDDTMDDWKKLDARDKRHMDRLSPRERRYLDLDVHSGHKSVNQDRQLAHKERRGYRKPIARSTAPSGRSGKYYKSQQLKKASQESPEEIKKRKKEDMRRRMSNAAERQGLSDQYDLYDIILSHLLDEGYASTPEAAEAIMVNMSEEWRESICEAEIEPPRERVGALTNIDIPMSEREAARQRTLAKAKAKREKRKSE